LDLHLISSSNITRYSDIHLSTQIRAVWLLCWGQTLMFH
jgi:hypothetical protein